MTPIQVNMQNQIGLTYTLEPIDLTHTRIRCGGKSIEVTMGLPDLIARWGRWNRGAMVQTAFSPLPACECEFLISGITPREWEVWRREAEYAERAEEEGRG